MGLRGGEGREGREGSWVFVCLVGWIPILALQLHTSL